MNSAKRAEIIDVIDADTAKIQVSPVGLQDRVWLFCDKIHTTAGLCDQFIPLQHIPPGCRITYYVFEVPDHLLVPPADATSYNACNGSIFAQSAQ